MKRVLVEFIFKSFDSNDWIQNENENGYYLIIETPIVFGVYDESKNRIYNIDTQTLDNNVVRLKSPEAFSGYVCISSSEVMAEDENENDLSEEALGKLSIEDWDLM